MNNRIAIGMIATALLAAGCQTAPLSKVKFAAGEPPPEGDFVFISPGAEWNGAALKRDETAAAFARVYVNAKAVAKAEVFVTALGVFELYLNDSLVSVSEDGNRADFLRPGATDPNLRRQYLGYDITDVYAKTAGAENTLSAFVARSWFSDELGGRKDVKPALALKLRLSYIDGTSEVFATDESWRASFDTPFRRAGIYWGEEFDGSAERSAAVCAGRDRAVINKAFTGVVSPMAGPGVSLRRDLALGPVDAYVYDAVEKSKNSGEFGKIVKKREYKKEGYRIVAGEKLIVDFGQNAAAIPLIVARAPKGVTLTFKGAEMLNDGDGAKKRGCDGPEGSLYRASYRSLGSDGALVRYTFAGAKDAETYLPSFTFMGYRYAEITATGPVEILELKSIPVTSIAKSMERGTITTGNKYVNRLVSNTRWGMYSNYLSIPTDCPQRDERMGWAADTQIFAPAAFRLADVYGFLSKWMADMRDAQSKDKEGRYPSVAPCHRWGACKYGMLGWADAGIIVPWTCWRMTGDLAVIRDNWRSMCRFMDYQERTKYKTAGTPDKMFQYADWVSFEKYETCSRAAWKDGKVLPEAAAYWDYLAGCYWYWNSLRMTRMAVALGRRDDATRFAAMSRTAREYLRSEFFKDKGRLPEFLRDMQTPHLFALHLGLYEDSEAKDEAVGQLVKNFQDHGMCLQTGFLGTSILMDCMTCSAERPDIAYTLLLQHKFPGWLYSVDQGATTVWERWNSYTKENGFGPVSMNSFNHYAYGAVIDWLYSTAAGIQPGESGGFDGEFILAPVADARLKSVDASFKTGNGVIRSSWRYEGGRLKWRFTVPKGSVAHVRFNGVHRPYPAGTYELEGADR